MLNRNMSISSPSLPLAIPLLPFFILSSLHTPPALAIDHAGLVVDHEASRLVLPLELEREAPEDVALIGRGEEGRELSGVQESLVKGEALCYYPWVH